MYLSLIGFYLTVTFTIIQIDVNFAMSTKVFMKRIDKDEQNKTQKKSVVNNSYNNDNIKYYSKNENTSLDKTNKSKNFTKLLFSKSEKRDFFDLMEFLNDVFTLSLSNSKKTSSKATECEKNLKIEDGKNWTCKVKYHKKSDNSNPEPLFCACYYEYACDTQIEKFHFSKSYMIKLKNENKQKNINRGPDYQCEKLLFHQTEKNWACTVKKELAKPVKKDDEFYCECFHQNTCKHERIVDFY